MTEPTSPGRTGHKPGAPAAASAWHDTGSLRALRELLETAASMRQLVARRAGLGESELSALEHLSRGPLGPAELARRLEVTTAATTGIVDRLATRGHVVRRPHALDGRRTEVHLTGSGRREVVTHLQPMFDLLTRLDGAFTAEERRVVESYLRGAIEALEEVTGRRSDPCHEV